MCFDLVNTCACVVMEIDEEPQNRIKPPQQRRM